MAPPVPQGLGRPRRPESASPGPRTGRLDLLPCIVWACLGLRAEALARSCRGWQWRPEAGAAALPAPPAGLPAPPAGLPAPPACPRPRPACPRPRPACPRPRPACPRSRPACPRPRPACPRPRPARSAFRGPDGARGPGPAAAAAGREGGTAAPASPLAPVGCGPAVFCIIPAPRQLRSNGSVGAAVISIRTSALGAEPPWSRERAAEGRQRQRSRGRRAPGHGPAPAAPPAPPRPPPSAACAADMSGGQQRCRLCTGQAGGGGLASL
uniref:uncharacterized protein n=1 Tax=Lonchura striata TaxID=40157 RepID=UPI000B4DEB29|nr:uncharacterized protein LOC110475128 [Lonchura striata domestica]